MKTTTQSDRIIFGLKVRQLRQGKQLSFADLSKLANVSVSYLNEIEKGKKYPKEDKITALSKALEVPYEQLISSELDSSLAPVTELLQSNFLNELPLDLFGIEVAKVVEIIANAPSRVGAFISTLLEISRNYALKEEHFYFGALRSYLELHDNYFQELEDAVEQFKKQYDLAPGKPVPGSILKQILESDFGYTITEDGLSQYEDLQDMRSVFLQHKKQLLLNGGLSESQKTFQYGKEIAFNYLKLKERAGTSSLLKPKTFEEVLNHSKGIYFSVALRVPLDDFVKEIGLLFKSPVWDAGAFLGLITKYEASPEIIYHRLTNVLPKYFGIKKLYFLRFTYGQAEAKYKIDRELHLSYRHPPHSNGLSEHYCRRWVAVSLLKEFEEKQKEEGVTNAITRAQRSHYVDSDEEYLNLTIARSGHPGQGQNVSVTIGMLVDKNLEEQILFLNDPSIQTKNVNRTCERCIMQDCKERVAEPMVIIKRQKLHKIQEVIRHLDEIQ
ncbi:MAG: helix-turn-helix domain-containing protein [Saprospiraceae bacterium]|nr:helix-turn-helix domain-containing protein [Saprospiraceae bacterium]MCB9325193.1 helix-turn-helix domain-containing protein [Lewinellaceae bacterium]